MDNGESGLWIAFCGMQLKCNGKGPVLLSEYAFCWQIHSTFNSLTPSSRIVATPLNEIESKFSPGTNCACSIPTARHPHRPGRYRSKKNRTEKSVWPDGSRTKSPTDCSTTV